MLSVLFHSNLSRRPFLGQVVNFDLLLCTGFDSEHEALFLCHIFTQRPMADRKIERSEGRGIVRNKFSPIPSRISARNLQSIKTFLTLELSQYRKSGTPVARLVKRAVRGPQRLPPTRKRRDPPKQCRRAALQRAVVRALGPAQGSKLVRAPSYYTM